MKESKRHHYLSECYLKGFTNDGTADGNLFAIKASDGQEFYPSPGNIAVIHDFNAVEGRPRGELENALAKVEGILAPCLERVIKNKSIADKDDWAAVLNLAAMYAVRNPNFRSAVGDFISEIADMVMQINVSTPHRWASHVKQMQRGGALEGDVGFTYDEIKQVVDNKEVLLEPARGYLIDLEFGAMEPVLRTLVARTWSLFVIDEKVGTFITTDHPICLTDSDGRGSTFQKPIGHGLKDSIVMFPLSKNLLAMGTFGGTAVVVQATCMQAGYLNSIVATFASRHILAANNQFPFWLGKDRQSNGAALMAHMQREYASQQAVETPPND